jgi:hypothetical protein
MFGVHFFFFIDQHSWQYAPTLQLSTYNNGSVSGLWQRRQVSVSEVSAFTVFRSRDSGCLPL